jgi:hypothetical protein
VSQAYYLRGLESLPDVNLHVMCTMGHGSSHRDWARFYERYNGTSSERYQAMVANRGQGGSLVGEWARKRRSAMVQGNRTLSSKERHMRANSALKEDYFLSERQVELMEKCYYATDAALFKYFCKS